MQPTSQEGTHTHTYTGLPPHPCFVLAFDSPFCPRDSALSVCAVVLTVALLDLEFDITRGGCWHGECVLPGRASQGPGTALPVWADVLKPWVLHFGGLSFFENFAFLFILKSSKKEVIFMS